MTTPPIVVVMGVCGCGKSSVGRPLAARLGVDYLEGDDLHPPANIERMAAGTPLTDDDRRGWLQTLAARLAAAHAARRGLVVTCSALKRSYRDVLRSGAPGLRVVFLHGTPALLVQRLAARSGHYMPPNMLASQLAALEEPGDDEQPIRVDIRVGILDATECIVQSLCPVMPTFTQITLYTADDGRARFREDPLALSEGKPQAMLSPLRPSGGLQLRHSPVGFRSVFHCTETPQWVFILGGQMEIGLQDGSSRVFRPGEHFFSDDRLPAGASFDPAVHGHWSRQVGAEPLVTAFVRA